MRGLRRCRAGHESTCIEFQQLRIGGGFADRLRATHVVPLAGVGPWAGSGSSRLPASCAAERVPRGRVWLSVAARTAVGASAAGPRRCGLRWSACADRVDAATRLGAHTGDGPVYAAVVTAHGGLKDALARVEPGGTVLVFAAPAGDVPVALDTVYRRELHVIGSRSASPAHFRAAIELLPDLDLPQVTTLPLERFAEGVELYRNGDALKVVFAP